MEVRSAKPEDMPEMLRLNEGHSFPFPELTHILYMFVVEDNGKMVAWGYTRKYVEVVFIPDIATPRATKVKSLKLINEKSTETARAMGIDQLHSYVKDEGFAKLLVERFNYGVCTGIPLFLNLEPNG
jgi:hypothetical protein